MEQYCIYLNKRTKERECRFYFPRSNIVEAKVTKEMNLEHWMFVVKRNNQLVNHFNYILITLWLVNIDIISCTDVNVVANYMGKYCSKAEKSTELYTNIV